MDSIYRLLVVVHRILLLTILIIFFVAKILVGTAGHSSDFSFTDYVLFVCLICTAIFLSLLQYTPGNETTFSKVVQYTTVFLLVIGVVAGVQTLYANISGFDFSIAEKFLLILNLLFIASGSILCFGLIKNRL